MTKWVFPYELAVCLVFENKPPDGLGRIIEDKETGEFVLILEVDVSSEKVFNLIRHGE